MREQLTKQQIWDEGQKILLASPKNTFIDVDIEADGVSGFGSMLSVGAVGPEGQEYYSEVKPITDWHVPHQRQFCEDIGLDWQRLKDEAPYYKDVMSDFNDWTSDIKREYGGKRPVFSAFNAAFDWAFVDAYFKRAKIKNPYGIAPLDLKSVAIGLTEDWNFHETSKNSLPEIILPDEEFTHHALEDAIYQQKIHRGLAYLVRSGSIN